MPLHQQPLGSHQPPSATASHGISPRLRSHSATLSLLHVMVSDKELEGLARPLVSDFPPASDCTMATVLSLLFLGVRALAGSR